MRAVPALATAAALAVVVPATMARPADAADSGESPPPTDRADGAPPSKHTDDAPPSKHTDGAAPTYRDCMTAVARAPAEGLALAERWAGAGGGDAAGHCRARALVGLGRYAEAAQAFLVLVPSAGGEVTAQAGVLAQAAQAWLLAGETGAAVSALDRALSLAPDDARLYVDRAEAHAASGRWPAAVDDLDHAIALDPTLADAYAFRGSAHRKLNRLDEARADLDRALELAPGHPEALMERGMVRALDGDPAGARADWQAVVETAPDTPAAAIARENLKRLDAAER
jgi:tetratricopeptide (TPR) repeat protein